MMDRAAVNPDTHRQPRLDAQRFTDLQCAFHWLFHRTGENQRHSVAGRKNDKFAHGFGRARKGGEIDDDPLYSAMIVQNGETLTGNLRVDGRYFKLRPLHGARRGPAYR